MTGHRSRFVVINGKLADPEGAVVSVYDRGFLYGDSVFEVLRTYQHRAFALTEHVDRLFESARRIALQVPLSQDALMQEVRGAIGVSTEPECLVRVQVTRGAAPLGLDPSQARDPLRVVFVEPLVLPPIEDYRSGIAVVLAHVERTADNTAAAGAKVANYLVSLLAIRDAHARGAKEAIIVDGRGRVLEGTTSNVFVVNHGTLLTPPESEGILPGITRRYLLKAAESLGVPVRITTLCKGDLTTADELFVSSTVREVLPVVRVEAAPVADGKPGSLTRQIHKEFRKIGGLPSAMPWEEADGEPARGAPGLGK
jgi:branched-chain amino acid aminotransferase